MAGAALALDHRAEFPTFKKVLEAMPADQFAYRPHERSPSALEVVWTSPLSPRQREASSAARWGRFFMVRLIEVSHVGTEYSSVRLFYRRSYSASSELSQTAWNAPSERRIAACVKCRS